MVHLRRLFQLLVIFTAGFLLLAAIMVFLFIYNDNELQGSVCSNRISQFFCGTKDLSDQAQKGKPIFNSYCAACHKLDAKSSGPALRSVDSVKYWKWLTSKNRKTNPAKLKQLGIEYHQNYFSKELSRDELENILEYLR